MSTDSKKIHLPVSNLRAYVWDVQDIRALRSEHRICGILAGTLPHLSQQNVFLGVPLVLMPEEVVLLVDKELAVIVDDRLAHRLPSETEKVEWNTKRKLEELRRSARREGAKSDAAAQKSKSEEAFRKRHEREQKRAAASAEGSKPQQSDLNEPPEDALVQTPPRSSTPASVSGPAAAHTVVIPTSSTNLAWYQPEGNSYPTLEEAREAGIWLYPSTAEERARCAIFRHLWEKGYYMGSGIKFGGEFLVYPGDPLRYHSHFTASVLTSPSAPLRPMEVVAHGRLGTATKKAHLLCAWDENEQKADVYSLEWAGFG